MYPYKFIFSNDTTKQNKYEKQKIICGIVSDKENNPIKDAIVKVEPCDNDIHPIYIITDEDGEFIYGPLKPNQNIKVKVWVEDISPKKYIINTDINA